jgi:hypothetical protein
MFSLNGRKHGSSGHLCFCELEVRGRELGGRATREGVHRGARELGDRGLESV